ncbi:hypothetical protein [Sandaracinus amylolyticus]|uniref:hypothetical protein n=1 Tax=Sandaracinus amylolyticus TaxID=927083 RepID=UPI001F1DB6F4|nr:hypothetical protein [Sandaracinus amylolyticus]UJR84341.1 Hypothetical protein I5071_64200 [Sandaracinus amylolyticus]
MMSSIAVAPRAAHAQAEAEAEAEGTTEAEAVAPAEAEVPAEAETEVAVEAAAEEPEAQPPTTTDEPATPDTTASVSAQQPADQAAQAPGEPQAPARGCTAQDVLRGLCTAEQAAASAAEKFWRVMGRIDYQQPIVLDRDPENDILMFYYLGVEFDVPVLQGLYATAWGGLSQRFWTVDGESAVDFTDPFVGVGLRHSQSLRDIGLPDHSLHFVHRLAAYFPVSRESRANLYYTALDWITAMRLPVIHRFMVGVDLRAQYRFHEYAEQNGAVIVDAWDTSGGLNTRLRLEAGLLLQQGIFDDPTFGSLIVQGSAGIRGLLRYMAADESTTGARDPWEGDWYWSLGATYTPIEYVSLTLSLEHGYSDIVRGGVQQIIGFDRDETRFVVSLFGRY